MRKLRPFELEKDETFQKVFFYGLIVNTNSFLCCFVLLRIIRFLTVPALNALGISSQETFPNSQISASYSLDDANALGRPEHSILNNKHGSWCSYYNAADEWLELDLGSDQTIYGVAVQGAHDSDSKVTEYTISLRVDGASVGTWLFETVRINVQQTDTWYYIHHAEWQKNVTSPKMLRQIYFNL